MNENIGNNLKILGQVVGYLCLAGGIITGIVLWVDWEEFWIGIIPVASGVFIFLSCWVLYGLGHLITTADNLLTTTDRMHKTEQEIKDKIKAIAAAPQNAAADKKATMTFDDLPAL